MTGPGAYPREPYVMRQASSDSDPWAGDLEHSPQFMQAVMEGRPVGELTDGQAAEVLGMTGETLSPVDWIIRWHPELFPANHDARNYDPAASAFEQSPEVLLKPPPFEVHEVPYVEDATDPDGGLTSAVVARLQREHPEYFSPSQAYGANVAHRR